MNGETYHIRFFNSDGSENCLREERALCEKYAVILAQAEQIKEGRPVEYYEVEEL